MTVVSIVVFNTCISTHLFVGAVKCVSVMSELFHQLCQRLLRLRAVQTTSIAVPRLQGVVGLLRFRRCVVVWVISAGQYTVSLIPLLTLSHPMTPYGVITVSP